MKSDKTIQVKAGSLEDVSARTGQSLAETFMSVDLIVICDTSGSMSARDEGYVTRYDRLVEALTRLQQEFQGKIAVIAFSSDVIFCPHGQPDNLAGSTNMSKALKYVHMADDCGIQFILISDGEPDNHAAAMSEAKKFKTTIDTIYIGPETDRGRKFLEDLAKATGGNSVQDFKMATDLLEATVRGLLQSGSHDQDSIQL